MTQKKPRQEYSPKRNRFNISKIYKYSSLELIPQELVQYPRQPHHFVSKGILGCSWQHRLQQQPNKRYPQKLIPLYNPQNHSKDIHLVKANSLIFPYKCRIKTNNINSCGLTDRYGQKLMTNNSIVANIQKNRQSNKTPFILNKNPIEEKEYFAQLKIRLKRERNYLIKIESKPLQKNFGTLIEMSLRKRRKTQIRKDD